MRGSATGDNEAQPRTKDGWTRGTHIARWSGAGEDAHDAHLHNGKCLVVQQLLLPQIIIQCRSVPPSVVSDLVGGCGGGYLL